MTDNKTNWYTIKVQFNHEQKVADRLALEMKHLEKEINVHIPKERIFTAKNGKKVAKEKAIYPGYIFVETKAAGELSRLIRETAGASHILKGKDGNFATLRKDEVIKMMGQKEELESPFSEDLYIVGESVKILSGPFENFNGKIDNIDINHKRVKVLVNIFMKQTPVELEFEQITKI